MGDNMGDYIREGVVVLLQRDKTYRPFILKKGRKVASMAIASQLIMTSFFFRKLRFEKIGFYPDGALGERFGSCFKVEKQQLRLFQPTSREITEGTPY